MAIDYLKIARDATASDRGGGSGLGGLQGLGGPSRGEDPYFQSPESRLGSRMKAYQTAVAKGKLAGVEDPLGTKASEGLLSKLGAGAMAAGKEGLSLLDAPRRAVWEAADFIIPGDQSHLQSGGDIIQMQEDDPFLEKALKGVGAFALDMATDPLTYLTFGTGTVAKMGGMKALKEAAKEGLQDIPESRLSKALAAQAKGPTGEAVEDTFRAVDSHVGRRTKLADKEIVDEGVRDRVATALTDAHTTGGYNRMQRLAREMLGDDGAEQVLKQIPEDFQTGLRLRVPGTRMRTRGKPLASGGRVGEAVSQVRTAATGSRAGQIASNVFKGPLGEDYGRMMSQLAEREGGWAAGVKTLLGGADDEVLTKIARESATESGAAKSFLAVQDSFLRQAKAKRAMDRRVADVGRSAEVAVRGAPSPAAARRAYKESYFRPTDYSTADLTPSERIGVEQGQRIRNAQREIWEEGRARGMDMGDLGEDYVPLIPKQEHLEEIYKNADLTKARSSLASYNPEQARKAFAITDPLTGERMFMTPDDVNMTLGKDAFLDDPTAIFSTYGQNVASRSADADMFTVFSRSGMLADEIPEGAVKENWKTLSARGIPKNAKGKYAPDFVVDSMERFHALRSGDPSAYDEFVTDTLDPLINTWRALVTVGMRPGFHSRNMHSGAVNNWLAGVRGNSYRRTGRVMSARKAAAEEAREAVAQGNTSKTIDQYAEDLLQERLSPDEWRMLDESRKMGIGFGGGLEITPARGEEGVRQLVEGGANVRRYAGDTWAQRLANRVLQSKPVQIGGQAGQTTENFLRLSAFDEALRRYNDPDMAAEFAQAVQYNYRDLSEAGRRIKNTYMPFFVFTSQNVPMQMKRLLQDPAKFNAFFRAQGQLREMAGEQDDILPEWVRERFGFGVDVGGQAFGAMMEHPGLDLEKFVPSEFTPRALGGEASRVGKEFAAMASPHLSIPAEMLLGQDLFTGAPTQGVADAPMWAQIPGVRNLLGVSPGRSASEGPQMPRWLYSVLQDAAPPVGIFERQVEPLLEMAGVPGESKHSERALTNWISYLIGPGTMTLTPDQQAGELGSRMGAIEGQLDRTLVDERLRQAGLSSEEIRELAAMMN